MNRKMPLNKKLSLLSAVIMVPLMLLVVYLIAALVNYGDAYNEIVRNITIASGYNFTFREELDYTAYRIVINEKTYDELIKKEKNSTGFEGDRLKDPYQIINKAKSSFSSLLEAGKNREDKKNIEKLEWILKYINRLEEMIITIESNIETGQPYRENEKLLNNAVYILTDMTQEAIQKYIQEEAEAMEVLRTQLKQQQDQAVTLSVYALILIFTVSLYLSKRIFQSVTQPIKELCRAADAVGKGDFTSRTEIVAGDEIQVLTDSFNNMKVEIRNLIEDVKIEKDNLRVTEIKLLQAQINPHFLYNTLDAIIWLAESGQTQQVVEMVASLSEFFRTVLSKGKDFITIREEISHIDSYLKIQRFRYQDILDYEITISHEIYDYRIQKLTLQPLVENALYHGIKHKRGMGMIKVIGYLMEEDVIFKVIDNGIGLNKEQLEKLKKAVRSRGNEGRDGFGLSNVDERIKMSFGSQYGLDFESEKNAGTTVTVTLPASAVKDDRIAAEPASWF